MSSEQYRGDSWAFLVTANDANKKPLDLTGASLEWKLANTSGADVLTLTRDHGIDVLDDLKGRLVINVDKTATVNFVAGEYLHQLRVTTAQAQISTQFKSYITVLDPL